MLAIKNQNKDVRWKLKDGIRRTVEKFQSSSCFLRSACCFPLLVAIAVFISGCTPAGPHALLKGKKYLDRGDYADAVAELKTATSLLATNAQAWNYLGLAYQYAGEPADAAAAYQRALTLNRDLVEAHYNLGCLWLDENKPDAAMTEFTAYTLRRNNAPDGWLKLGWAQLHARELASAEKSFGYALYLSPNNAEALNGLGLAQVERGRPGEAAQYFSAATRAHPDYAPALLNLATVTQTYLRDDKTALQYYRAYLALTPHPANWNDVNALANSLEQPVAVAAASPPAQTASQNQSAESGENAAGESRVSSANAVRPAPSSRVQPEARTYTNPLPSHPPRPTQVAQAQSEPVMAQQPPAGSTAMPVVAGAPPVQDGKPGTWHRLNPTTWFHSSAPEKKYLANGVTPLPSVADDTENPAISSSEVNAGQSVPAVVESKPARIAPPPPPVYPRYSYLSPHKPKAGDRKAASGAFERAREFEQEARWLEASKAYQQAAALDPGWFEAQYDFGVLAYRLQNYPQALAAYESALAIEPDSTNARYNFALALRAAGYVSDAVNELRKIVAANPNEVRAHLALGNIYAQQLHDAARARLHYLKVLALDPGNAQATDIQFWLGSNPP
jgi:tetratricopeptide (TPR) repeat protein